MAVLLSGRTLWVNREPDLADVPVGDAAGRLVNSLDVGQRPGSRLLLSASGSTGAIDLTSSLEPAAGKGWRRIVIPLWCLGVDERAGIDLRSEGVLAFDLDAIGIVPGAESGDCRGPF